MSLTTIYSVFFCLLFRTAVKKAVNWINENLTPASSLKNKNWEELETQDIQIFNNIAAELEKSVFNVEGQKVLEIPVPESLNPKVNPKPHTRTE